MESFPSLRNTGSFTFTTSDPVLVYMNRISGETMDLTRSMQDSDLVHPSSKPGLLDEKHIKLLTPTLYEFITIYKGIRDTKDFL